MPPGTGKTFTSILTGVVYASLFSDDPSFLYVTYNHGQAVKVSSWSKSMYKHFCSLGIESAKHLSIPERGDDAKGLWRCKSGLSFECSGVGGGRAGDRWRYIIIDDLYRDHRDAWQPQGRERVRDYFVNSIFDRQTPDTSILSIMTRWHEEDISSTFMSLKGIDVKNVVIAAQAEGIDPLEREPGEFLDCHYPPKYFKMQKENMAEFEWSAKFQQNPTQMNSSIFTDIEFGEFDKAETSTAYIDTSFSGTDTTSISIAYKSQHAKYHCTGRAVKEDCNSETFLSILDSLIREYNIVKIWVEKNADQGAFARSIRDKYSMPIVDDLITASDGNKHARILTHAGRKIKDLVFDNSADASISQKEWEKQILSYEEGRKPCDAPDSLAGLLSKITSAQKLIIQPASLYQ